MINYERERFGNQTFTEYSEHENFDFPRHLHRCLELTVVIEGILVVEIDKKKFVLRSGEATLCLPNQIHSFKTNCHSKMISVVFSPDLVPTFMKKIEGKTPTTAYFKIQDDIVEGIRAFWVNRYADNVMVAKGLLYLICGCFLEQVDFTEDAKMNETLMLEVVEYVQKNFTRGITLQTLSKALGYNYHYLSRYISKTLQMPFNQYLNEHRIEYAVELLLQGKHSITDIAMLSGFASIRTFNNAFQNKYSMPPSQYVKKLSRERIIY